MIHSKKFWFLSKRGSKLFNGYDKIRFNKLGIIHDSFVSEKSIVDSDGVINAIKQLKKTKHIEEGYLEPPKVKKIKIGKN